MRPEIKVISNCSYEVGDFFVNSDDELRQFVVTEKEQIMILNVSSAKNATSQTFDSVKKAADYYSDRVGTMRKVKVKITAEVL